MAVSAGVNDEVEVTATGLAAIAMPASMLTMSAATESFQVFTIWPLVAYNDGLPLLFSEKPLRSEEQTGGRR
jgi:hypothetical protein